MYSSFPDTQSSKAEISFDTFPLDSGVGEAERVIGSIEGVKHFYWNASVRRASVCFNPKIVGIPSILSALSGLSLKPKVISVITPCKGVS